MKKITSFLMNSVIALFLVAGISGSLNAQTELLVNNGFDDGLNNWELWNSGTTTGELTLDETSKIDGPNSAHIKIVSGGGEGWTLGFAQGINGGVKAGKKYVIKYKAVASEPVTIHQMVQEADSPWGAVHSTELALTTEVQTLVDTFEVTADVNCNFVFQIGDIGTAEIWLDDIYLTELEGNPEPEPGELLSNNYFDDGLNNWEMWNSGTTTGEMTLDSTSKIEGKYSVHIKIVSGGGEGWTLGFAQGINGGVKAGKKYVIKYKAVASEPVTIHQMIQEADSPWGAIHSTELALTTDVQELVDTFEVTVDANCNFVYQIGDIGTAEIWLDDIHLIELEGGEPEEGELLLNNYFNDSLNNWQLWNSGTTTGEMTLDTTSKIEGKFSVHIKIVSGGGEAWTLGFAQGINGGVKAGKKYVIKYKAVASEPVTIHQMIQETESPWGAIHSTELALTTEVQTLVDTFEVATDASCNFVYQIGDIGTAEIWLDDIHLIELEGGGPGPEPGEILQNNYFDSGLDFWQLWESATTHGEVNIDNSSKLEGVNSAHLKITDGGGEAWTLGFAQGIQGGVTKGSKYVIKFMAVASQETQFNAMVQQTNDPWGPIYSIDVNVGTEAVTVVDTFEVTTTENCNFVFQFGNIGSAELWIDDVHLILISGPNAIIENNTTFLSLEQNFPNPFCNSTTIAFSLAKAEKVDISVFDISGKMVKQVSNKVFTAGNHKLNIDLGDYPGGIYYCRMSTSHGAETIKMVSLK